MSLRTRRSLAAPAIGLMLLPLFAGCSKKDEAAAVPVALPGGQTAHNIDNEPGMTPEAKESAKKQFQQMQQNTPASK